MFFYKCIPLSYIFEKALVTVPVWDSPVFLFTGDELSKKKKEGRYRAELLQWFL